MFTDQRQRTLKAIRKYLSYIKNCILFHIGGTEIVQKNECFEEETTACFLNVDRAGMCKLNAVRTHEGGWGPNSFL